MPFNGSGTFSRSNGVHSGSTTWAQDAAAGEEILSSLHDSHDQDVADALTNCLTKDGQTTATANQPMGGFIHTTVGNASARTHYGKVSQIQDFAYNWAGDSAGAGNTYTASLSPAVTSYSSGMLVAFRADKTNSGTATLNLNGVGAKNLAYPDGTNLTSQSIQSGSIYFCQYDATASGTFRVFNPFVENLYNAKFTELTASRYVATDASKLLVSKTALQIFADSALTISTWTPGVGASGSMTTSAVVVNQAKYERVGAFYLVSFSVTFTLGGTASNFIYVTGFSGIDDDAACTFPVRVNDGGGSAIADPNIRYDLSDGFTITKPGGANFSLGANASINFNGLVLAV